LSEFYAEMQGVATDLLTEFQQGTIVLVRSTPTVGDTDRPWDLTADPSPTRVTLRAAARTVDKKYVDGTRIHGGETQVTLSVPVLSPEPTVSDRIEIDGVLMTTVDMHRLPDAGTPVAFVFIVRR
jgi:hypothetical protein